MNSLRRIETLAIGDELLTGKISDSNSTFVGGELFSNGLRLIRQNCVLDKKEDILAAIDEISKRAKFAVCFGGLGPTSDDITAETVAFLLCKKLVRDEPSHQRLIDYLKSRNRQVTEQTLKQVLIPEGTMPIPNHVGLAPGFYFTYQGCNFFFLPGVPAEMKPMMTEFVLPQILKQSPEVGKVKSSVWRCIGIVESELQRLMVPIEKNLPSGLWLGYRTRFPENYLYLYSEMVNAEEQQKTFQEWMEKIEVLISSYCYGKKERDLEEWVLDELKKQKRKVVTAESCTGGLVVQRLTQVPGASDWVWGGFVTYQVAAKENILNVNLENPESSVSSDCSERLALSALKKSHCDIALGITGYMGPTGGTSSVPIGTVFISVVDSKGKKLNETVSLPIRPRSTLQWGAASFALNALRKFLQ